MPPDLAVTHWSQRLVSLMLAWAVLPYKPMLRRFPRGAGSLLHAIWGLPMSINGEKSLVWLPVAASCTHPTPGW